jgi:hypothetical protein
MRVAALALQTAMDDVIDSEGAESESGQWQPFNPNTFKRHPNRIGGKLLQSTGVLANIQTRVRPREAEAYSPAPYAGYHVSGTKYMPKRDFTDVKWGLLLEVIGDSIATEIVTP